ncbi:hypothetical protein [Deinococcus maricopensis]|uniref:Uncharacterized protein n=1 Tax=Deinococcus maricopensis (strain DSM 21211 / LMG 22137 / NRRL B-23946 / LB-34) TaxID=709986 RepID=E8U3L5_DEIML|nr:hypothetical protein [Deinococcus maricopensis]ADV68639.1 hypothetical protein Deima_3010 [Deinococcus maricopensis DSM 21211]
MKRRFREDPYPASGRGYVHVCPTCTAPMPLYDTRDGDQAYWCHTCDRGHRASDPPPEALRPLQNAG